MLKLFLPAGVEYKIDEQSFLITEHKETWDIEPIEVKSNPSFFSVISPGRWEKKYLSKYVCFATV